MGLAARVKRINALFNTQKILEKYFIAAIAPLYCAAAILFT